MLAEPSVDLHVIERGDGPPLLLVHGVMISGEMFEPVLDALAARHRVIVPDLRGHGRSRSLPPPYTVKQHPADLTRLLDRLGVTSADVLGYSQGGAVAQQLALDHPGRCRRLVLDGQPTAKAVGDLRAAVSWPWRDRAARKPSGTTAAGLPGRPSARWQADSA